jgi:hypothetical protein
VDANGVYVGTLINRSTNGSLIGSGQLGAYVSNHLISTKGYAFVVTDSGEVKSIWFDGYENDACLGPPTLFRFNMINSDVQDVFKQSYSLDPANIQSPNESLNVMVGPDLYYMPKQSAFYQQQVYVFDVAGTKSVCSC